MAFGVRPAGTASGPARPPRLVSAAAVAPDGGGLAAGAGGLATVEMRTEVYRAVATADEVEVSMPPVGQGLAALIERLVCQNNSGSTTTFRVYVGSSDDENLIEFTGAGNLDVADEFQPLFVPGTSPTIFEWRGVAPGDVCIVRVQVRVVQALGAGF